MNADKRLMTPARPALRWHGGKWRLAPWIIEHFPPHQVYVEPFGGAASVLLRKPRSHAEIYNDLDEEVVNLFRVLREPRDSASLIEQLRLTLFARGEFELAQRRAEDAPGPIERARRLIVLSFMGFGSNAAQHRSTGFRANSNRSGTTPAHDWANYPSALATIVERLRGVVIEKRDAREVMQQHDGPATLHYLDPPYMHATRCRTPGHHPDYRGYKHEMTDADHRELLKVARGLTGLVVISGYATALYDDALGGWRRVERATHADGARPRMEALWLNPAVINRLDGVLPFGNRGSEKP